MQEMKIHDFKEERGKRGGTERERAAEECRRIQPGSLSPSEFGQAKINT